MAESIRDVVISLKYVVDASGLTQANKAVEKATEKAGKSEKQLAAEAKKAGREQEKAAREATRAKEKAAKAAEKAAKETAAAEVKAARDADQAQADARQSQLDKIKAIGVAIAAAFAVDRIRALVASTVEWADELATTASRLGVSTDALQELQFIAERSDVSTEALASGMQKLQVNLGQASVAGSTAAKQFRAMGIDVRDSNGQVRSSTAVLTDAAERISHMGSQAERSAAAVQLFGRGGIELLPLLQQGGAAVADLSAEYAALGVQVDGTAINALENADDAFVRIKYSTRALAADFVARLVPAIEWVQEKVSGMSRWFREGRNSAQVFGVAAVVGLAAIAAAVNIYAASWVAAAAATWTAVAPVLAAVAAGLLLGLALDDIFALARGEDSLLGQIIGPEATASLREMLQFLGELVHNLLPAGTSEGATFGNVLGFGLHAIIESLRFIFSGFVAIRDFIVELTNAGLLTTLGDVMRQAFVHPIESAMSLARGLIESLSRIPGLGEIAANVGAAFGVTGGGGNAAAPNVVTPPASVTNNANRATSVQGGAINIVVNGTANPQEVGSAVGRSVDSAMNRQLNQAAALAGAR